MNGRPVGRRPVGPQNRFRAEFDTPYARGEIVAVAHRGGAEVGRMSLRSATGALLLQARSDRSQVRADGFDLAFLSIALVDPSGSLFSSADRRVHVSLEGPGSLQGLGSANPRSGDSFTDSSCATFDGQALAVVRPTGDGVITVSISADGCEPQLVCIQSTGS